MDRGDSSFDGGARTAGANWHLAWAAAFLLAAAAWPTTALQVKAAIAAAAAPGLAAQAMRVWRGRDGLALLAFLWACAVGAAAWLAGGATGPLACLAVAPAAAMASFGDRRAIALGAAATVAVLAFLALVSTFGAPQGSVAPAPWLAVTILSATLIGAAASFQLCLGRLAEPLQAATAEAAGLRALLAGLPGRLLRIGPDGGIAAAYGTGGGPMSGPLESLADERDRWALQAALRIAAGTGEASVGVAPLLAPDRFLVVDLTRLADEETAALVRDASPDRALQAYLERRRAEAEEEAVAKSRFLANMSHELRTPLNAIIGFSDIMRSRMFGPIAARYAEYAGLIHESGGHLLDLINDVLDMSKIEAERYTLSRERFDAREPVAAALRLTRVQADASRIDLRAALPPEALTVDADRRALKQIVLNLVSNALKFTQPGGQVTVVARALGRDLELIVADTGVGIAPEDLERLGRPYEQAGGIDQRARGTGLGLSLVRAFAELHGGEMTIRSVLGEGTVVTVMLPVIAPAQSASTIEPGPEALADVPHPSAFGDATAMGDNVVVFNPHR